MPLYEHENFGDVQDHTFMKGTITAVNSADDTADVTIEGGSDGSGVPIFYHCEADSEERDNGAIEGAASGFAIDDEVIVMCTVNGTPIRVVGFVDGIKSCTTSWIVIGFTGGYTVFDVKGDCVLEIDDEDGNPITFPQLTTSDTYVPYTDFAEVDNDDWRSLWRTDTDYGEYHAIEDADMDDVYDYSAAEYSYMFNNEASLEKTDSDSPANALFPAALEASFYRYREISFSGTHWNEALQMQTLFTVQWDDTDRFDDCHFLYAANGSDEKVECATRFRDEAYYDRADTCNYGVYDARFKTYRKRTVEKLAPPDYLSEHFASEEVEIYNRFVERKQPWDFDDLTAPDSEAIFGNTSEWFSTHPNWDDVIATFKWTPRFLYICGGLWPYGSWNNRYDRYNSQAFGTFQEDRVTDDQYVTIGLCADCEGYESTSFKGTDGCSWQTDPCPECTDASDTGEMYDLHNEHRASIGKELLVPNSVIADVAEDLARAIDAGTAPYDHTGFDERVEAIQDQLNCATSSMGENINRIVYGTEDVIETCFQEWLDSPGHRENIEFSSFTMMGYGSAGEYHVAIFATLDPWLCAVNRKTALSMIKMSDEALANMRTHMELGESSALPWESIAVPEHIPADYVSKGYVPLGTEPFGRYGGGPIRDAILNDNKIRSTAGAHLRFMGEYCDNEEKTVGIYNVVIGYPYSSSPMKFFSEDSQDTNDSAIVEGVHVHASIDISSSCDTTQSPIDMETSTAFEEAIKEALQTSYNNPSEDTRKSFGWPTFTIAKPKS